jgi:cell division protein FtsB
MDKYITNGLKQNNMMLIVVIDALILLGLVLKVRDNNKLVNELLRFQLKSSNHVDELGKELVEMSRRVDVLEAQAKQQGWPYDPTKK